MADAALSDGPVMRCLGALPAILLCGFLFGLIGVVSAEAETFRVESVKSAGEGTLSAAIAAADARPGSDTIEFAPGLSGVVAGPFQLNTDVVIRGNGQVSVSGEGRSRAFLVGAKATVAIERLTIARGAADGSGGGAILNDGKLTLRQDTINDSTAVGPTGPDERNGGVAYGGAIFNRGQLEVIGSTLTGNQAVGGEGGFAPQQIPFGSCGTAGSGGGGFGGAIFDDGQSMVLVDTTVAGNTARGGKPGEGQYHDPCRPGNRGVAIGGGIYSQSEVTRVTIRSVTLAENSAGASSNLFVQAGQLQVENTIIANPRGGGQSCGYGSGTVVSSRFSLDSGSSCLPGDATSLRDANPLLGPLADNGGPTSTMALPINSPAVDRGSSGSSVDQRGFSRPVLIPWLTRPSGGDGSDIGAFEAQRLGQVGLDPTQIAMGEQPVGSIGVARQITVSDLGPGALRIDRVRVRGQDPDDFIVSGETCTDGPLALAQSCVIRTRFAPSVEGHRSAVLEVLNDSVDGPQLVPLSGVGTSSNSHP